MINFKRCFFGSSFFVGSHFIFNFCKSAFIRLKRSLLRLYPKRRKLFEDLGESTFTYKAIIDKVNAHFAAGKIFLFKNIDRGEKPKLMESINVSFLCPDHEFRSMI